jgi:hypothetical protein
MRIPREAELPDNRDHHVPLDGQLSTSLNIFFDFLTDQVKGREDRPVLPTFRPTSDPVLQIPPPQAVDSRFTLRRIIFGIVSSDGPSNRSTREELEDALQSRTLSLPDPPPAIFDRFSLGHHRLWTSRTHRRDLSGPGQSQARPLRRFHGQRLCRRWSTDHNYRWYACHHPTPLHPHQFLSLTVPRCYDDLQLRTSLASLEESSALNSWTSSAHNPSGSAQRSSPKLSRVSTFLPVHSDTGVRVRKIRSPRRPTLSSSPLVPVRSVWVSRAKIPIGRVESAHAQSVTVRFPSSGVNLWR